MRFVPHGITKDNFIYWVGLFFLLIESVMLINEKVRIGNSVLMGTYVLTDDHDQLEYVYQLPPIPNIDSSIGVLFLAHGCSHSALDFWPKSNSALFCPTCTGLPVERNIVLRALSEEYVVVALSSKNRETKCWSPADIPRATKTIKRIRDELNLPDIIPNFMIGASSGGSFVGSLAVHLNRKHHEEEITNKLIKNEEEKKKYFTGLHVYGISIQVSVLPKQYWGETEDLPPLIYVHMPKDQRTTKLIDDSIKRIPNDNDQDNNTKENNRKNDPTSKTSLIKKIEKRTATPRTVTPDYFSNRENSNYVNDPLSSKESKLIVGAFYLKGIVDNKGMLLSDPRESNWRDAVLHALPDIREVDSLVENESAISELMNVAWGNHEITDEFLDDVYDFFGLHNPLN